MSQRTESADLANAGARDEDRGDARWQPKLGSVVGAADQVAVSTLYWADQARTAAEENS